MTIDPVPPPQWPPASLRDLDLTYCQMKEVSTRSPDRDLYIVHMAGLLYHQKWMAARHLFRRSGALDELRPWYQVAMAALKPDLEAVWKSLEKLYEDNTLASTLIQVYVNEITHAFRFSCLRNFSNTKKIPSYLAPVLGFATVEDMSNFAQEHCASMESDNSFVVAAGFLQSRLNADISLETTAGRVEEVALGSTSAEATLSM